MAYYLVHGQTEGAPSYNDIRRVLTGFSWQSGRSRWVGPGPRVTRTGQGVAGRIFNATASFAWLLEVPDDIVSAQTVPSIVDIVRRAVGDIPDTSWTGVAADPWNAALHGAVAWWQGGQAAQTRTRDDAPSVVGLTSAENPLGPDLPDSSIMGALGRIVSGQSKALWWTGGAIVTILVLYLLVKLAPTLNMGARRLMGRRSNPRVRWTYPRGYLASGR